MLPFVHNHILVLQKILFSLDLDFSLKADHSNEHRVASVERFVNLCIFVSIRWGNKFCVTLGSTWSFIYSSFLGVQIAEVQH